MDRFFCHGILWSLWSYRWKTDRPFWRTCSGCMWITDERNRTLIDVASPQSLSYASHLRRNIWIWFKPYLHLNLRDCPTMFHQTSFACHRLNNNEYGGFISCYEPRMSGTHRCIWLEGRFQRHERLRFGSFRHGLDAGPQCGL